MKFPEYPAYKDSGINWLGRIPSHWEVIPLKGGFDIQKRPTSDDLGVVTAFRDGQVTLRSNRRIDGFTEAVKEIGYQGVEPDDLIIHAMDAFAGAIGVSDSKGKSSPVYSVCKPREGFLSKYYGLTLRAIALTGYIQSLAKGIRERSTDFRWSDAKNLPIPKMPYFEQVNIINFLERETGRINELIKKQEKLLELYSERISSIVLDGLNAPNTKYIRLMHACDVISRPVIQRDNESYRALGLFNRGRGIFIKDARDSEEMGESDFFWVKPGDLIFSGQFAWEGSVAISQNEHDGCVVSHRYPVIRGKDGIALTEYLLALFLTRHGDFLLNENSRGAAGRNKPLNMSLLLKERIPILDIKAQEKIRNLINAKERFIKKSSAQIELLKEHRASLIYAAVTGKIDVRELVEK